MKLNVCITCIFFKEKIDVINNTDYEYKHTERSQTDVYNNAQLAICLLLQK